MIALDMAIIMRNVGVLGRASPSEWEGSRSTPSVEATKQGNGYEKKRLSLEYI
jgi:hypothetical protein